MDFKSTSFKGPQFETGAAFINPGAPGSEAEGRDLGAGEERERVLGTRHNDMVLTALPERCQELSGSTAGPSRGQSTLPMAMSTLVPLCAEVVRPAQGGKVFRNSRSQEPSPGHRVSLS